MAKGIGVGVGVMDAPGDPVPESVGVCVCDAVCDIVPDNDGVPEPVSEEVTVLVGVCTWVDELVIVTVCVCVIVCEAV